jgi:prophage tail gpP-like protein
MPDLVLRVDGQKLTGWETFRLERSLEAFAGAFSATVSDRRDFPIPEGAAVEAILDGFPILTGWIDVVRPSFDARSRSVTIAGRDRTAELVDCSPVDLSAQFEHVALDGLASDLARPFGVQVVVAGDPGAEFERFALHPGETVHEALERAARLRGVLLTTDGLGRLVLEKPGTTRAAVDLVEGENLLAGTGRFDRSSRFRRYVVRGQLQGSDLLFADETSTEGEAFDEAVRSVRTTLILAEAGVDIATAQKRAEWEAAVRRARGSALQVTLQGWRQGAAGPLWIPNVLARLRSPTLRIDRVLLVSSVLFTLDPRGGTTTELDLVHPDAYSPEPSLKREDDLSDDLADPEED